jgi:heterodisulfide reductase subunit A
VLIAACLPYVYARKLRALGNATLLDPSLMEVVDLLTPTFAKPGEGRDPGKKDSSPSRPAEVIRSTVAMGVSRLTFRNPEQPVQVPVFQRALVLGGGIAGMTAALGIADHGFPVDLVEKDDRLGGNLNWLKTTLEGNDPQELMKNTIQKVEKHSNIKVYLRTQVIGGYGQVGRFYTALQDVEGNVTNLEHGAAVIATGGREAITDQYGFGKHPRILTQKALEQKLADGSLNLEDIESVVMIQCVGSREEPRNYCSRVCCAGSLKHALKMKQIRPECSIYVLYRDMMTYGFLEPFFTSARKNGILFISYGPENKPVVSTTAGDEANLRVHVYEPIIRRHVEIEADLLVLATGITPVLPAELAGVFGARIDPDGFFQEADSKWRPVDSLKEGIFACGLAHSPRSIGESIATAEACAQKVLRLLFRQQLPVGRQVAKVRHSLCSLCERCVDTCPYGARILDSELQRILVNPAMCQGCGACAAVCPNSAAVLNDYGDAQMLDVIDAAFEGTR